jgi:hypothetical protein
MDLSIINFNIFDEGPFHLIYTPPYGREFLRGVEKAGIL